MKTMSKYLPSLLGGRSIELYGFDVSDSRVQKSDFFDVALRNLAEGAPGVDWHKRLRQIKLGDDWPFDAEFFDFVVTNQVLEHVIDLDGFLENVNRVLKPGGRSINLFPVRSSVIEGHVGIPFAHWIKSNDVRELLLTTMGRLGLSRMGPMRLSPGQDVGSFGVTRAEYVATQTNYRSFRQIARAAERHGLVASYRWTPQYYLTKLGYMFKRDASRLYVRRGVSVPAEVLTFPVLAGVANVTIVLSKSLAYDPNDEFAGHLA